MFAVSYNCLNSCFYLFMSQFSIDNAGYTSCNVYVFPQLILNRPYLYNIIVSIAFLTILKVSQKLYIYYMQM